LGGPYFTVLSFDTFPDRIRLRPLSSLNARGGIKVMRHRIFAVIAAVTAVATCYTAPALARGSGGHGGSASHGAAIAFGSQGAAVAFGPRGGVFFAHGTVATRGATGNGFYRSVVVGRVVTPIRPEVINVPAMLGTGGVNPPFNGTPIVPPLATGTAFSALPVVTTPYAGGSVFGYGFNGAVAARAYRVSNSNATASGIGAAAIGVPQANPVDPNTLQGTCHPVPYGYHCDWSS